jgi:2'-5' RNA ligase
VSKGQRLFFAVVPGQATRQRLEQVQQSLGVAGRAAKPGQFHATLAFLGMQQPDVIPEIHRIASCLSFEPCRILMDRFGQFKRAGVLWMGASEVPVALRDFQDSLVSALLEAGIGHDRKAWKFHITLYRKLRKPSAIMDPVAIEWPLNGFDLIESVSVGNGVKYHSIGHWNARS